MTVLILILLVLGFVLFLLAGCGIPTRWNLTAFGLAAWILTVILALPSLHLS